MPAVRCCSCSGCWKSARSHLSSQFCCLRSRRTRLPSQASRGGAGTLAVPTLVFIGVLLVIGFGAKLGLLPFYEWFPGAYGSGSGASGALMSGVVLNAAFYGLSRGLLEWRPGRTPAVAAGLGIFVISRCSAQRDSHGALRVPAGGLARLLSFSSAENAAIAVAMLGAALIFRGHGMPELASLAWTVALLHLRGACARKRRPVPHRRRRLCARPAAT